MTSLIIGAAGGIGAAFLKTLAPEAIGLSRISTPPIDLESEPSIQAAAAALQGTLITRLIIATGFLHGDGLTPEKTYTALSATHLAKSFAVNAIGPALILKHFLPLIPRDQPATIAALSAKVGSITDNAAGGWYSYRAAKAALNQLIHTTAIELKHKRPHAIIVALHPGTVDTPLSAPFAKTGLNVRPPAQAAADMLRVLNTLTPADSGKFFSYDGTELPW